MAEDAADLGDVEADVNDQTAGEGVAEVVEAQAAVFAAEQAAVVDGSGEGATSRSIVRHVGDG